MIVAAAAINTRGMVSFSVIIPTRNRPGYLREAVVSVLGQSLQPREVIVVDDGEGAENAVRGMSGIVRVIDSRNRGPVRARTAGVASACADAIAFLDDDDRWIDRDHLARASALLDGDAALTFADGFMAFEDGRPARSYSLDADAKSLEADNTILISAVCYLRALHEELGDFDEMLPYYWDWDWYLRVARAGHCLAHVPRASVAIRIHANNMSGDEQSAARGKNLGRFAAKHGLGKLVLKNHLDLLPPARAMG